MPLITFNLVEESITDEQCEVLLQKSAALYAQVLSSPIERIRGFIHSYPAKRAFVGGDVLSTGEGAAPYFEFVVLAGRPQSQIQTLTLGFTELLVEVLGVDKSLVRGCCRRVSPDDWGIAGQFASELRAQEIAARAEVQTA